MAASKYAAMIGLNKPIAYLALYPALVRCAREMGYALALHGSMERDFDLIAVPWTAEARPAAELVAEVVRLVDGYVKTDINAEPGDYTERNPEPKPHGRLAWAILLGRDRYIDLSVMPRIED